uniref:Uncharacterized protein n=1 Tax=Rousettus aegyptiacus TaxID=9407 RepID=A0A7J8HSG9_ROUAE|nr:hypothetical protein HJG63_011121 [Rousettus aegyptiacus]
MCSLAKEECASAEGRPRTRRAPGAPRGLHRHGQHRRGQHCPGQHGPAAGHAAACTQRARARSWPGPRNIGIQGRSGANLLEVSCGHDRPFPRRIFRLLLKQMTADNNFAIDQTEKNSQLLNLRKEIK